MNLEVSTTAPQIQTLTLHLQSPGEHEQEEHEQEAFPQPPMLIEVLVGGVVGGGGDLDWIGRGRGRRGR
jgi:hypothetical protein